MNFILINKEFVLVSQKKKKSLINNDFNFIMSSILKQTFIITALTSILSYR